MSTCMFTCTHEHTHTQGREADQELHEKVLNTTSHKRNANKNHSVLIILLLSALGRQRIADIYEFKSMLVYKVSSKPGNEIVSQNKITYKTPTMRH